MAPPLRSLLSHGRSEARSNPAICGPSDAVGVKLDADPVKRTSVNVGSDPTSPFPSRSQRGGGQARRPLLRRVVTEPP